MPDATGASDSSGVPTLAELIAAQKSYRGYSYRQLEARADSVITAQRWQQLGTGVRIKEFPEPSTIQAMAEALEVDVASVVLAAARSIGLPVRRAGGQSDLAAMLPAAAAELTTEQRDAILALVRSIVRTAEPAAPVASVTSLDTSRASDVETLNPDDEVTEEQFQTAARTVPGKPREQIEYEEHSVAGEESQVDPGERE